MPILYNCVTTINNDGQRRWRITKFNDGDVESSYLCTESTCDCPAGVRPTCRHRQMLPKMIVEDIVNTHFFLDWGQHRSPLVVTFDGLDAGPLRAAAEGGTADVESACEPANITATEVDERIANYAGPFPGDAILNAAMDQVAGLLSPTPSALAPTPEPPATRQTFTIPEGHEAVRDAEGRATGEVRPIQPATPWRRL